MDEKRLASLKELEGRLGYRFNEIEWLDKAFTHRSFINETDSTEKQSNEILEFLGDAVLNLAVSHLLLQKFPEAREGTLSMWRAHLVKKRLSCTPRQRTPIGRTSPSWKRRTFKWRDEKILDLGQYL